MKLKYVKCGFHTSPDITIYFSALDIPNLGIATDGRVAGSHMYLVYPLDVEVFIEPTPQYDGGILYDIELENNPDGIWFRPGGTYAEKYFIGGSVAAYSSTPGATNLYRPFVRAVTRGFVGCETSSTREFGPWGRKL